MSSYAEFLREVDKQIGDRVETLVMQVTTGAGMPTIEAYREKVGEIRAYRAMVEIIKDAADAVNQRSSKA